MILLLAGITLWAAVHWFPMALPEQRNALVAKLGEGPYKGIFALLIAASIAAMVLGWKQAPLVQAYLPPLFGNWVIAAAIALALILFFASQVPNNLRRIVRHPQLTGVIIWGAAHLLVNGSVRDVLLFGGLGVWAAVGIWLSNRRDGAWQKPAPAPLYMDAAVAALGLTVAALTFHFHGWLFGVTPIHLS